MPLSSIIDSIRQDPELQKRLLAGGLGAAAGGALSYASSDPNEKKSTRLGRSLLTAAATGAGTAGVYELLHRANKGFQGAAIDQDALLPSLGENRRPNGDISRFAFPTGTEGGVTAAATVGGTGIANYIRNLTKDRKGLADLYNSVGVGGESSLPQTANTIKGTMDRQMSDPSGAFANLKPTQNKYNVLADQLAGTNTNKNWTPPYNDSATKQNVADITSAKTINNDPRSIKDILSDATSKNTESRAAFTAEKLPGIKSHLANSGLNADREAFSSNPFRRAGQKTADVLNTHGGRLIGRTPLQRLAALTAGGAAYAGGNWLSSKLHDNNVDDKLSDFLYQDPRFNVIK